jgi:hypothetical protein
MRVPALVLSCVLAAGCAGTQYSSGPVVEPAELGQGSNSVSQFLRALAGPGPGLAAHDPPSGQLFDQIPAWDGAAMKVCCSALSRDEYLKMRCDTDQPVYPRTNRC